jgi:inositol-1,3,4-trisphosphate 5/6-kinase / inositol-tetrakisphosphate 1-kinase
LQDYKRKYPDVVVLDPPEAILQLRNRQSMLQDVAELDMSSSGGELGFLTLSLTGWRQVMVVKRNQ